MKKSKLASGLAGGGGVLALALALSMTASQVAAIPYASQIRFSETEIIQALGVDLLYTLNEDADSVTVEVYNSTTETVVRTFNFSSPDPETTRGRHAIPWDNRDQSNNLLPISNDELTIRVRVQKTDDSLDWTPITSNSSAKATEQQTIFAGFSSNDLKIPVDPTANQFGLMFATHSFNGAPPGGNILLGMDLAPVLGNGGGPDNVRGQHPAEAPGNFSNWKSSFDPLDPDLLWTGGQTAPQKVSVFNIGAVNAEDIQLLADNAWGTGLFPRGFAVGLNDSNQRIAYIAMGNVLYRAAMDTTYPHTLSGEEILSAATLDGVARYAQDVKVDAAGNVYFLNRLPDGDGRLWRWNKADVDAAPGVLLDETNAAWIITAPVGSNHFNALHIDPLTGEVFVANAGTTTPRGVYYVGNTSDASITKLLTADDQILDYTNTTQFPVAPNSSSLGQGIAQDWQGNFYVTNRIGEEIYSFSPPARASVEDPAAEYDITTTSPTAYSASVMFDQSNLVFVNHTNASPNGVVTFNSLRAALLSFGPGGHNNGFAGTNIIEVQTFGPYDEELPDLTAGFDADDFEIVTPNGPALVLQRNSSWELGRNVSIDGLVIAASATNTPSGTLVSSTAGAQTITNSWITALPNNASTFTEIGDIPAGIADGSAAFDGTLVRAGNGLTISGANIDGSNLVINQHANGVVISSGSLELNPSQVVSNSADGVSMTGGSLGISATSVSNNGGAGITANNGAVTMVAASLVSNNGGAGISTSGNGSLSTTSTFANPNQILNNSGAGIAYGGSSPYQIRNTMIHGNNVGLDLLSGGYSGVFFNYDISDVIISGSTVAGIRTADASQGISAARLTLYNNGGSGILDQQTRGGLWSIELQDTIIAGAGDIGINSPGAGEGSILLDYAALATAGPDALSSASNAPANAFDTDFGQVAINADPMFRSTAYSANRIGPDFYLAPTNPNYVGASKPSEEAFEGGTPFQNLGGGSRWALGPGLTTITVGTEGQLYSTLADAFDAVSSLGSSGGQVLTILIETNTFEPRATGLYIDNSGGGGVLVRPADGVDVTVEWDTTFTNNDSTVYGGTFVMGAPRFVSNEFVVSENIVIDGRPAGSPEGTSLTFSGNGRHLTITPGAKDMVVRNTSFVSLASNGAVISPRSTNLGGIDHHPDNLLIENNFISALASFVHVGIVIQPQGSGVTSSIPGLEIRNNRIEYESSGIFMQTGHGSRIHGNELVARTRVVGIDTRGIFIWNNPNLATPMSQAYTTNIYNNVLDLVSQTSSATQGIVAFWIEATGSDPLTYNYYNNFISMQVNSPIATGASTLSRFQGVWAQNFAVSNVNFWHNSVHVRAGAQGVFTNLPGTNSGIVQYSVTGGLGSSKANVRNNLIRLEEARVAAFNFPEVKLGDIVEDYNTVYRVTTDLPTDPPSSVTAPYGVLSGAFVETLADWRTATGKGMNSDEAVIALNDPQALDPEENPTPGFTGIWTSAADRVTDPNALVLPDFRWTAVPGDSSVWGGVPGLLTDLPGGNADIDGTTRNTGKPYRGAHEGATLPGDNIPPDEDPPPGDLGDINGDGEINVADVTALAQAIADGNEGSIPLSVGDINDDGVINDLDVQALANMIVNP